MRRELAGDTTGVVDALGSVAASIAAGADRNFVMRLITRSTRKLVSCDLAAVAVVDPTDDLTTIAQSGLVVTNGLAYGPSLFVPIVVDGPRGMLWVSRLYGREGFTDAEHDLVRSFAAHAGVVLERDLRRRRSAELQRVSEQWQLAKDLQSVAGEQISRVSFRLSGLLSEIGDERTQEKVVHAIDDLDHAIKILRQIAFGLTEQRSGGTPG